MTRIGKRFDGRCLGKPGERAVSCRIAIYRVQPYRKRRIIPKVYKYKIYRLSAGVMLPVLVKYVQIEL